MKTQAIRIDGNTVLKADTVLAVYADTRVTHNGRGNVRIVTNEGADCYWNVIPRKGESEAQCRDRVVAALGWEVTDV